MQNLHNSNTNPHIFEKSLAVLPRNHWESPAKLVSGVTTFHVHVSTRSQWQIWSHESLWVQHEILEISDLGKLHSPSSWEVAVKLHKVWNKNQNSTNHQSLFHCKYIVAYPIKKTHFRRKKDMVVRFNFYVKTAFNQKEQTKWKHSQLELLKTTKSHRKRTSKYWNLRFSCFPFSPTQGTRFCKQWGRMLLTASFSSKNSIEWRLCCQFFHGRKSKAVWNSQESQ